MAKKSEVFALLDEFLQAYPECKLSAKGVDLYVRKLTLFDIGLLQKVFDELTETCRFFPTIADIYEKARQYAPPYPPEMLAGTPEWEAARAARIAEARKYAMMDEHGDLPL